jgi:hypothetical protein
VNGVDAAPHTIVCAWCHKVQVDEAWVERQPGDDVGDDVIHGVCPDCRELLWPGRPGAEE